MHAGSTDARLDALGTKIDDLARNIAQRFEQVDAKIDDLARSIDKRFEQVDKRFEQVDKRLLSLESHFFHMQLTLVGGTLGVIAALLAAPHL